MNFYRKFDLVQFFIQKPDRNVVLAKPQSPVPGYPSEFIIKVFNHPEPPNEVIIHKYILSVFPQALQIYDEWMDSGCYFFCLEYCVKGDLHNELTKRNGELYKFDFILYRCLELANIVQIMHSYRIVHRDIKPLNVYITADYEFKLADFGEAKYVNDPNGFQTVTGTPYYMSPEIRGRHFQKLDLNSNPFRDDIWGLARTFIEISFGRLCPEIATMSTERIQDYLNSKFAELSYPAQFVNLIASMMSQNLNDFAQARQVFDELLWMYTTWYPAGQENSFVANDETSLTNYTGSSTEYLSEPKPSETHMHVSLQPREKYSEISNQMEEPRMIQTMPVSNKACNQPASETLSNEQSSIAECAICNSAITDIPVVFSCGHNFHKCCTAPHFEKILSEKKKLEHLQCCKCKAFIKPDMLSGLTFKNEEANLKLQLLIYSVTKAQCPRCKAITDKFMLSKFEPKNERCQGCKSKFCTFCSSIGGHRFYCDLFKLKNKRK